MKNVLPHLFNYEMTILGKKNNLKSEFVTSGNLDKTKTYGLKISQSIIYVKDCFYIFFSTPKDIAQIQNKITYWISWNLMTVWLKGIQRNVFRSLVMPMPAQSSFEHWEDSSQTIRRLGTRRALEHLRHSST